MKPRIPRGAAGAALLAWLAVGAAAAPPPSPDLKPAFLQVSGYGLLGNRELKHMLLTVELQTNRPHFFDPAFVADSVLLLTSRVKNDGYLEPTIAVRADLLGGGRIQTTAQSLLENPLPEDLRITGVHFKIHKGKLYHFQSLQFIGLDTIPEKQARSYFMATDTLLHPKSARIYTPERLQRGISSLAAVLDQQGYREVAIRPAEVRLDPRNGDVRVVVRVRQGPKFIVRSVDEQIHFQALPGSGPLRTVFPDQPYSTLWSQNFILSLKTNEYIRGFPDVSVVLQTLGRETNAGVVQVDLLAKVDTGPNVRIGAVDFEGARRTRRWVMARRVRVKRGELLDPVRAEDGRYRLAELGIFDTVDLRYKPVDEHTRNIIYQVEEAKALTISLLFGWGSYELLRGGFIISENNILGLAHRAEFKAVQSFKSSSGEFRYTVPEVVGKDVDIFLNASALRREEVDFTRLEYGGGMGVHKYFKDSAADATLRYNYQILNTLDTIPEVAAVGLTNPAVGSFIADVKLDRRDNPLYPRKGFKIFATVESAAAFLGGDANFERVEVSPAWYHSLGGGRYLSLGLSQGTDVSFGSSEQNLPFNKRFFPGGPDSIRGYQQDEASPRNSVGQIVGAETYTLGTVQFEQALTPRWSLVLFSDSLGFARNLNHYPFDTTLFSVGAGIWWRTLIGPVRLEYGHNLNPRPGDPSGTIQFSLGFPF